VSVETVSQSLSGVIYLPVLKVRGSSERDITLGVAHNPAVCVRAAPPEEVGRARALPGPSEAGRGVE
jgi:hypothetical protein